MRDEDARIWRIGDDPDFAAPGMPACSSVPCASRARPARIGHHALTRFFPHQQFAATRRACREIIAIEFGHRVVYVEHNFAASSLGRDRGDHYRSGIVGIPLRRRSVPSATC